MEEELNVELANPATDLMDQMVTRAMFIPNSLNKENRTIEVVAATESPNTRRVSWDTFIDEILVIEEGSVDLNRFKKGANLLDNHKGLWSSVTTSIIGVIEEVRIENRQLICKVRFASEGVSEVSDATWRMVEDGILTSFSVGFRVKTYEKTERDGQRDIWRATLWEPFELSAVAIPADRDAKSRSLLSADKQSNLLTKKSETVGEETNNTTVADTNSGVNDQNNLSTRSAENQPSADQIASEAVRQERRRVEEIQLMCRNADMVHLEADFIKKGTSIADASAAIFRAMETTSEQSDINTGGGIDASTRGDTETDNFVNELESALYIRSAGSHQADEETKRRGMRYVDLTLIEMARRCLEKNGVRTGMMSTNEIITRAMNHSTSNFPVLLEGTIRRALLAAYNIVPDSWRNWCAVGSVTDFRPHERLRLGSFSKLDKVMENGNYSYKKIDDATKEQVKAETYGNLVSITRKMIVNDDLDGFSRIPTMLGRAAALSIEVDAYALLAENSFAGPTMNDGNPLFHSSHGNIGQGAALTAVSLDADRVLMGRQKDESGNDFILITPYTLLVPLELKGTADIVVNSQYDPDANSKLQRPNMVRSIVSNIIDTPRLSGTRRYMFANPAIEPVIEVSFLNGVQEPFLDMQEEFKSDGMTWKVRHDYGVGAVGYKGAVLNAGV